MIDRFTSSLSSLAAPVWVRQGTVWASALPLFDTDNAILAELTYRDALAAAVAFGARLPTRNEIIERTFHGYQLAPVTLPTLIEIKSAGLDSRNPAIVDAFRNANMSGLAWAKIHSQRVYEQLRDAGLLGTGALIANAGKHWIAGAPPGRAYLMGWYTRGKFIQGGTTFGPGPHDDMHHDYATTTILMRDEAP